MVNTCMTRRANFLLKALLVLVPFTAVSGQRADSASVRDTVALMRALAQLEPGDNARLVSRDRPVIGRFQRVMSDSVLLEIQQGRFAVAKSSIDTVSVRVRGTKRGMMIGGSIGGVVLGAAGVALALSTLGGDQCNCGQVIPLGVVVGTLGGALIGALAGSGTTMWKRLYP